MLVFLRVELLENNWCCKLFGAGEGRGRTVNAPCKHGQRNFDLPQYASGKPFGL